MVAAFRDLENSRWRQVTAVPEKRQSAITIGIEGRNVNVAIAPATTSLFSKDSLSKDSLSKGSLLSKDSLLSQATGIVGELVSMSTGGKLTPDQASHVSDLLSKANTLRGQLQDPGTDPVRLSQLGSNLLDLQKEVDALKALVE